MRGFSLALIVAALLFPTCAGASRVTLRLAPGEVERAKAAQPKDETIAIIVRVGGYELDSVTLADCALLFYGRGIVVRLSACGPTLIYFRAANLTNRRKIVRVSW